MSGVSFDIRDAAGIEDWLKKKTKEPVYRGIVSAAFRTLGVIVNELIPQEKFPPVFDGAYRAGWQVEITEKGADLFNTNPVAPMVEYGVRAENIKIGRTMITALTDFARRKLGAEKPEQVAWAIAMAMKGMGKRRSGFNPGIFNRDGKEGLRIGERAAARVKDFVQEEVTREYERS